MADEDKERQLKDVQRTIEESISELVGGESGLNERIEKLISKHQDKTHFVPIKYRVLGGFLQSLNIKFGNFIELLLTKLINAQKIRNAVISKEISGRKNVCLELDAECERLIDEYVNHHAEYSEKEFDNLVVGIVSNQNKKNAKFQKEICDVDLLMQTDEGVFYYVEIKYNDDHDTGKFKDINRKFLKTYAGLIRKLGITDGAKLIPILYYFNQHVRYNNKYLKEHTNIMRSKELFEKLELDITFEEVDEILSDISEKLDADFDKIREKIFKQVKAASDEKLN